VAKELSGCQQLSPAAVVLLFNGWKSISLPRLNENKKSASSSRGLLIKTHCASAVLLEKDRVPLLAGKNKFLTFGFGSRLAK
jgi:hypothetical protein